MSKIAVCGKGGSGKSVLTAMLTSGLRERGLQAIVVDADDSNVGLHRMLGFSNSPEPLIDFMGGKPRVEKDIEARIKSGVPENLVNLLTRNIAITDLPAKYVEYRDGVWLTTVGKIHIALEGCACPMGIISRSFLSSLQLGAGEVAIADMEAGVEHFGRGVETGVDTVLVAVDPSLDSLDIAAKIAELSNQISVGDVWAVISKSPSERVSTYLREQLGKRGLTVIGVIEYDNSVFEDCLAGRRLSIDAKSRAIQEMVDFLFP